MKAGELRDKTPEELMELRTKLGKELMKTHFSKITGQLKNKNKISSLRKDIARLITILKER